MVAGAPTLRAWLPIILPPLAVLPAITVLPAWVFMWALSVAVFAGCKWIALRAALACDASAPRWRQWAFLFVWPGMDAATFLRGPKPMRPRVSEWCWAASKLALGAALYWLAARHVGGGLASGWIGMAGLIFMLHFGSFHLLALGWQTLGVAAFPLMKNPAASTSLGEFWGQRWNVAFNEIAERLVFKPLVRSVGIQWAGMAAFVFSGLLHDLVISVPARAGFGLPTLYFIIQGLGVWMERSAFGRRLGLRRGWRGWVFAMAVTAAPAFWLFHPPFVRHIMLPMMEALQAL